MNDKGYKILSGDISLKHGAAVLANVTPENEVIVKAIFTYGSSIRDAKYFKEHPILEYKGVKIKMFHYYSKYQSMKKFTQDFEMEDVDNYNMYRILWIKKIFASIYKASEPDYFVVEGPIISFTKSTGNKELLELNHLIRHFFFINGVRIRIHDPSTLKYYLHVKDVKNKRDVVNTCYFKWGFNIAPNIEESTSLTLVGDIHDAYALMQLCKQEIDLRAGKAYLQDLDEHEIRVFNRTSHMYPVNILGREWIQYIKEKNLSR